MSRAVAQPAGEPENELRSAPRLRKALRSAAVGTGVFGVAAALRFWELGRLSFWYDEVVTMRLARAGSLRELIERLFQIDATRAPLHPILLHGWLEVFGTSEASARSLSVVCGLATLLLICLIGRIVFDASTGLWAAWLGALSPILVVYSREARMYAWLVLATCFGWLALLALYRSGRIRPGDSAVRDVVDDRSRIAWALAYGLSLVILAYSHPLGLVMAATLALAGLIGARACFGRFSRWLLVHAVALLFCLPWIRYYFDHPPEFLSARPPLRFLLGVPIGFIGGDFRVLAALLLLIALGVWRGGLRAKPEPAEDEASRGWMAPAFLVNWLVLPPVMIYLYSLISHPIFGPARYTAFVAPAFLVLVAGGLTQLPALVRFPAAAMLALVSALALGPVAFSPDLKADWRDFALDLAHTLRDRPGEPIVVMVASADPARNVEVETARYYLPESCTVIAAGSPSAAELAHHALNSVYFAVGLRRGEPVAPVPKGLGTDRFTEEKRYPGLAVFRGARSQ